MKLLKKCNHKIRKRFIYTIVIILLVGTKFSFGQKGFYMDEKKIIQKYKMSTQYFEKGKSLFKKEKFKKAEKAFQECIKIFPQHNEAHFLLSHIYYKNKDLNNALHHIEKAKEYFKFTIKMHALGYQEYLKRLQDERFSLQEEMFKYQAALPNATTPERKSIIQSAISQIKQRISRVDSKLSNPIPPVSKMPADYFYYHGNIFFKLKKFQQSHNQYFEALKIDPKHGNSYNNLANLYYMGKKYQKAFEYLKQAEINGVKINPKFKEAILKAIKK